MPTQLATTSCRSPPHTPCGVLGFLSAPIHLSHALLGTGFLQVPLTLAAIPVALLADHTISALHGRAGTRTPQTQASR